MLTVAKADKEMPMADTLINFLNSVRQRFVDASPAELLDEIIRPIEWLAGQQDGDALVRQIKDRLVIHGAALSIPPADAELAFDALYTAAFDAAKQKDGVPLTRAQFLRIFASATGIHVPKQELLALSVRQASHLDGVPKRETGTRASSII